MSATGGGGGSGTVSTSSPGLTSGQPTYATGLSTIASVASSTFLTSIGGQASGNYITALTGDVTASGPGSAVATLATVNSNVGTFTYPSVTVNGKGLITAISNGSAPTTYTATYPVTLTGSAFGLAFGTTTSNTWGGTQTFTNTISGSINGNAATVTNGVYTTTFPTLFDNRLSATTTLPNLTTLAGLSLPYSQLTGTPTIYPYLFPSNATSTALTLPLANATGLPLTTGVTGVLPMANGGTATSSAVTNGVYYYNGTNAEADSLLTFNNSTQILTTSALTLSALTGTQCLHEISGVVSGTGSDCGSGGGGTVGTGTTGQFPYYAANGTTLTATSSLFISTAGNVGIATTSPGSLLSVGNTNGINFSTATSTFSSTGGINLAAGCFAVNGVCISGAGGGGGVTSLAQTYGSSQTGGITLATSSAATASGVTVGQTITNTAGTFTFTPTVAVANIPNSALANSTISGVALGSNLANLSNSDGTLTFSGSYNGSSAQTVSLNLSNANTWGATQTFSNSANSALFTGGNVGIGTTTPWANLAVSSSAQQAAKIPLFDVGSTTGLDLFNVLGNGNVGIGTTSPFAGFSIEKDYGSIGSTVFSVSSSTAASNNTGTQFLNIASNGAVAFTNNSTSGITINETSNGAVEPVTVTGSSASGSAVEGLGSTMTASGSTFGGFAAGIIGTGVRSGTNSTGGPVGVDGISQFSGGIAGNVPFSYGVYGQAQNTGAGSTTNAYSIYGDAPKVTSGAIINSYAGGFNGNVWVGGNLGVGTTSPFATLSVMAGSTYASQALSTVFAIGSSTAGTATSTLFVVNSSGNVGIGTTSPASLLAIAGSTGLFASTTATSTFQGGGINLLTSSGNTGCFAVNGTCVGGGSGSGTVTSVGLSSSNSTLTIGSTPVTTSGTITADLNLSHSNAWAALQTFAAKIGVSTTTPVYALSVGTQGGTYGSIISVENTLATTTSMTVDWSAGNQQRVQIGNSATSIAFSNVFDGATLRLMVCNPPSSSAGAISFTSVHWAGGTAPTQTTTANQCDLWSFFASAGTSTSATSVSVYGAASLGFQ